MTFQTKLVAASRRNNSLLCVGLDPDPSRMPIADVVEFCRLIVEATSDLVSCFKPNLAFFEQLGPDGLSLLAKLRNYMPDDVPVLADAKRGDIGNTAAAHARAAYEVFDCDAVTVSPYMGRDSLDPFLADPSRTAFVLCRTSNPGARDFQDLPVTLPDGRTVPLFLAVAERCREWNELGNVGLVVGATYPSDLADVRAICPDQAILVPGIGAQQGDVNTAVRAGMADEPSLLIVSSSRQVLYASSGRDFTDAARAAALDLRDRINAAALVAR